MIKVINDAKIITKPFGVQNLDIKDEQIDRNATDLTKYPIVWIGDLVINSADIKYLKINYSGFLPSLEMTFSDSTNYLSDEKFPSDDVIISIHKESDNDKLMSFKMDFKMTNINLIKVISRGNKSMSESLTYEIDAIMNIDDLYMKKFESYKGTSYNILKEISSDIQLGFASNIKSSNDEMIWINNADFKKEFMKQIISKSYLMDNSFLYGYIDIYYNFTFIDVEKLLKEDISKQMIIVQDGKNKFKEIPLILTNLGDRSSTELFINNFRILNSSTEVNLRYGYRQHLTEYNKSTDNINSFLLDTISDEDGNNIIMKGNKEEGDNLYDNMIDGKYMGKIDIDNVHSKYFESELQNETNMKYMQKLKMKISLDKINYGLHRFQKILIEIYNNEKVVKESEMPKDTDNSNDNDHKIIHKLSGEWLIIGMDIIFSNQSGNKQEITLIKRELTEKYTFPRRVKKSNK